MIRVIPYGRRALRIQHSDQANDRALDRAMELESILRAAPIPGCLEMVPGFTTLLLRFEPGRCPDAEKLQGQLNSEDWSSVSSGSTERTVEIPVSYAGEDLLRVADHSGLSVEEVIERHSQATYRVHCLGFSPGFPYLGGLDPALHLPRRATPRTRVPAGSVAIGGEHTGIYSVDGPGGWNLVGCTPSVLFNPRQRSLDGMFLLRPGDAVRFVRTSQLPPEVTSWTSRFGEREEPVSAKPRLRVLSTGMGLTLQDGGRPGFARYGVPPSGWMDPELASLANQLVENPPNAPVLEMGLQGQRFEVLSDGWLALGGEGESSTPHSGVAFRVRAGESLAFPPSRRGVWRYLAAPGGWAGMQWLGSRSGGARCGGDGILKIGDVLGAERDSSFSPPQGVSRRLSPPKATLDEGATVTIPIWPGPQASDFPTEDWDRLLSSEWRVSSQCDRVGYRLVGNALSGKVIAPISEAVLSGSIQIPPDGQPIVTMPDGPTLGGYPKIAWMDEDARVRVSQCRPGMRIRWILERPGAER